MSKRMCASLNGKRIVILGGTSGIGLAAAKAAQWEGQLSFSVRTRASLELGLIAQRRKLMEAWTAYCGRADGTRLNISRRRRFAQWLFLRCATASSIAGTIS
jgi:NAD(P)-dependent dehydrogenase (short-subunit alcohol dehydrogenase family)